MKQAITSRITVAPKALWSWAMRRRASLLVLIGIVLLFTLGPTILFNISTAGSRFNAMDADWTKQVPAREFAIVFGAGVNSDGTPTPYLKWRVETAAELYKAGKVNTIVMSGDNSNAHYNEPQVMAAYAVSLGVGSHDIVLDYAGFSTYDTCYRAQAVFGITSATLVTQGYHLPRAMMTCNKLGVQSVGVAAAHTGRDFTLPYLMREVLSTDKSLVQVIFKPLPTVAGNPQDITHE